MPNNNFTQIYEDNNGEEWEVSYHFEGASFRGTLEQPPEEPWIEIDSIINIADGRAFDGDEQPIENYVDKNHVDDMLDDYADFYGEID